MTYLTGPPIPGTQATDAEVAAAVAAIPTDGAAATGSLRTLGTGATQAAQGSLTELLANKDTDGTLAANSDTSYASQKAGKTYIDTKIAALLGANRSVTGWRVATVGSAAVAQTIALTGVGTAVNAPNNGGLGVFYFDPAEYDPVISGKTLKCNVCAECLTNAVAPTINLTVGLYNVTGCAGGSGANSLTLSAVNASSTVAFNTQAASTLAHGDSGDFTPPVAGYYLLGVAVSGTTAASSTEIVGAALRVRVV